MFSTPSERNLLTNPHKTYSLSVEKLLATAHSCAHIYIPVQHVKVHVCVSHRSQLRAGLSSAVSRASVWSTESNPTYSSLVVLIVLVSISVRVYI